MVTVVAGAQLEELGEGEHLLVPESVEAVHVVHDDLHELWAARAHLEDLVELLLVLREEEARAAVVDDVFDLARRVRGVDAVGDAASAQRAHVRVDPLRAVVGHDGDDVAGTEAEGDQAKGDVAHPLSVLAPAYGAPDAEMFLAHG